MNIRLDDTHVDLRAAQPLRLNDATGVTITCLRGEMRITQFGDMRDVLLSPGGSFTLDRRGATLISSSRASSVRLEEPRRSRRALAIGMAAWRGVIAAAASSEGQLLWQMIGAR